MKRSCWNVVGSIRVFLRQRRYSQETIVETLGSRGPVEEWGLTLKDISPQDTLQSTTDVRLWQQISVFAHSLSRLNVFKGRNLFLWASSCDQRTSGTVHWPLQ